jgi:hypothetical protein
MACRYKRKQLQAKTPTWPVLICALVIAIQLLLLPFVTRTWRATGDEPHYLLAAHSLVSDRDFDLANNYDQLDYLAFYFSKDIVRQIRLSPAGQQILAHHLGLPLIIAPAYALGGRPGALVFQAIVGGLLALLTFKLANLISGDEGASLWATLFVTLSPPLFLYQYLVYPELLGAFLTTLILYYAVSSNKPTPVAITLTLCSLAALPWLNRRFIFLAILLAILMSWNWYKHAPSRYFFMVLSASSLILTLASILLLFWLNSRLTGLVETDFTTPATGSVLWRRLGRGIGWLFDQQRGLFIYAPVYLLAAWGLPPLIDHSIRNRRMVQPGVSASQGAASILRPGSIEARSSSGPDPTVSIPGHSWFVILPFLLSLGLTATAGGFWIAWELGPRFLIVALPALASLVALAWRCYSRSKLWQVTAIILFSLSLANGITLISHAELPYKSSLPLFYGEKLQLPLSEWLPDLAEYAKIQPIVSEDTPGITEITDRGGAPFSQSEPIWLVEAGRARPVIKSEPLYELPYGHYYLTWPIEIERAWPPTTELGRISIKQSGGGQIFNKVVTVADLGQSGQESAVNDTFLNPNVDRWRTPLTIQAVSSGQARLRVGALQLRPTIFHGWFLPYFYLSLIVAGACLSWYRFYARPILPLPETGPLFRPAAGLGWGLVIITLGLALGYFIFQQRQLSRTYGADEFLHFVGRPIADSAAEDGRAWLVDPLVDPPQKAIYGPFDIYDAGAYRVAFRLKLPEPVEARQEVAQLQVSATANFDNLVTQPLRTEHFQRPDLYHDFVLTIDNPRRQALSFDLYYLGLAALVIDQVTITKITE